MNLHYCEDSISLEPEKLPLDRFRDLLKQRRPKSDRRLALLALRGRPDIEPDEKLETLKAALDDREEEALLRASAAVEIGRLARPESLGILRESLTESLRRKDPPLVVRSVADALLRYGAEEAHELPRLLGDQPAVMKALRFPLTLYSFRENLDLVEVETPSERQLLKVDKRKAKEIQFEPAGERTGRAVAERANDVLPGVAFAAGEATSVKCGGQELAFLPVEGALKAKGLNEAQRRKKILGIVSVFYHLESDAWDPKYVVVTQPATVRGKVDLLVLTTTGAVAWASPLQSKENVASFTLRAVDRPGAQPSEITGSLRGGKLTFKGARSEQRKQKRRSPTRSTPEPPVDRA